MTSSTENFVKDIDEEILSSHFVENLDETKQTKKLYKTVIKILIFLLSWAYFAWATAYYVRKSNSNFNESTYSGYGLLVILFSISNIFLFYKHILNPLLIPILSCFIKALLEKITKIKLESSTLYSIVIAIFYLAILTLCLGYLIYDSRQDWSRLIPLSGLIVFLLIGFILSSHKSRIPWHTIIWGLILQFAFGFLTIRWETGRNVFLCIGDKVDIFLSYAVNGSAFVYGEDLVYEQAVFAFNALAAIYFLGFFINILYYYGIMQQVVGSIGNCLQCIMGTSICESVNSAANIFLGLSESPLLLKPYLSTLTDSEIHSVMAAGFASVSGSVLAAYISYGANASDLITASVMSAPAALCYSKLIYPEIQEIKTTKENIKEIKMQFDSVLDAATRGAHDAYHIIVGIISSLVAFLAFIYFVNGVLSWMGSLVGFTGDNSWTVELIIGKLLIPISYIMGVPWEDCEKVGQLIGIKTMVNEFVAFQKMQTMALTGKSKVIATYSICGFSNPGSVGIMISTLGTLIPNKREVITRVVFRACFTGIVACFMTACIAALLIPNENSIY